MGAEREKETERKRDRQRQTEIQRETERRREREHTDSAPPRNFLGTTFHFGSWSAKGVKLHFRSSGYIADAASCFKSLPSFIRTNFPIFAVSYMGTCL